MFSSLAPPAICAEELSKCYHLYDRPADRLRQLLWGRGHRYYREFWALREASFEVARGEVLGVVGRNGAGKSTLLQLVCGTLAPSSGAIAVNGRVTALLELGAGFNPEFSGRENVYLAASIMGLSTAEVEARFEQIVDFSGIRDFIEQPVKTYSSGMYVRLAFSVATNVDPDVLVIDEALSVGDGEFARKSFDRIMDFKKAGKTILFCSHSLYQVEAICSRALWLDRGQIRAQGAAAEVVRAYNDYLPAPAAPKRAELQIETERSAARAKGVAHLSGIKVTVDGHTGHSLNAVNGKSEVRIDVAFISDPSLPCPSVAAGFMWQDGRVVCSAATHFDRVPVERMADGSGEVGLVFPRLPLLKGSYWVAVYLLCENGIHVYDNADFVAEIKVSQTNLEQGIISLPHVWKY
jgi:lipopolysaccharide transport system ATP-binding protein